MTAIATWVRQTKAPAVVVPEMSYAPAYAREHLLPLLPLIRAALRAGHDVVGVRGPFGSGWPVRDAEVMHERLAALLAEQPVELVLGGVAARLADRAREDARSGADRARDRSCRRSV